MRRSVIRSQHGDGGLVTGIGDRGIRFHRRWRRRSGCALVKIVGLYYIVDCGADEPDMDNNSQPIAGKAEAGQ